MSSVGLQIRNLGLITNLNLNNVVTAWDSMMAVSDVGITFLLVNYLVSAKINIQHVES